MNHPTVEKYLARHAESDSFNELEGTYSHGVVIPIANEGPLFLETIESLQAAAKACFAKPLVICVINGRANAPEALATNRALRSMLWELGPTVTYDPQWSTVSLEDCTLLISARFEDALVFGTKEGVGTARKIGCDVALKAIRDGHISSPWIRSTDADVRVGTDYFEDINSRAAALTLPFTHSQAPKSLKLYETSLRYYVLGLHHAGSPYAFHTVGSTLAIHGEYYAKVRGFPKRLAAEDFYILNKLAKTGLVVRPKREPLRIRHRESERAPFGTGPAVRKITETLAQGMNYRLYDPHVFKRLGDVLDCFGDVVATQSITPLQRVLGNFDPGWQGLERMLAQGCSPEILRRQLHSHFDAFRTLKWVHYVRDTESPMIPWQEALKKADFLPTFTQSSLPDPESLAVLELERINPRQGVV